MTVNEIIIEALEPLGVKVTPDFFGDGEDEYITFNYDGDRVVIYGDNEPLQVVAYLQIHYFCSMDKNYLQMKKEIRKALHTAGCTYPSVTDATNSEDGIRHLVFECSIENDDELL
jgi:hypothetical protein